MNWGSDGVVERCVDKTRYGDDCALNCKKGYESYHWCWKSYHDSQDWEYCGPDGQTRYGARCLSECAQNGKDYWWCYTEHPGGVLPTKWEYCSPPSQVTSKKVTYTVHGQECMDDCGTHGEEYWWCTKSHRWREKGGRGYSRNRDNAWDYCSPQPEGQDKGTQSSPFKGRTRYNKPCKDSCESRGEDYFWCHTFDSSWDYCSPTVVATEMVIAKGGRPCVGICDTMGESYKWCTVISVDDDSLRGSSSGWWDYCGPGAEYKAVASTLDAKICVPLLAATIAFVSA